MNERRPGLAPAFYATGPGRRRGHDWWVLLHPPYTLWHLSYVAIGASLAPELDGGRLVATLIAFGLAVGVAAHALDELHGRPLATAIPSSALIVSAAISLALAVALGVVGVSRVGVGLLVFIAVGAVLVVAYNLELVGGRLHNDASFAAAWGAFPVLTAYYAQAETIRPLAIVAAIGAFAMSSAQRSLSTPARTLRRKVVDVDGSITHRDGHVTPISTELFLAPLEGALKAMTLGHGALAVALVWLRMANG